jgi:hypothetical protein
LETWYNTSRDDKSITVKVADNGWPSLGATQSFQVKINPLARPMINSPALINGQFHIQVNGDFGPDYFIQTSTNLNDYTNWVTVWSTNAPILPFTWTDNNTSNFPTLFYRLLIGP